MEKNIKPGLTASIRCVFCAGQADLHPTARGPLAGEKAMLVEKEEGTYLRLLNGPGSMWCCLRGN